MKKINDYIKKSEKLPWYWSKTKRMLAVVMFYLEDMAAEQEKIKSENEKLSASLNTRLGSIIVGTQTKNGFVLFGGYGRRTRENQKRK